MAMGDSELRVKAEDIVPEFVELFGSVQAAESFPNVLAAMNQIAALYRQAWVGFASGMPIPGVPRTISSRGPYKNSIKMDTTKENEKVVYSDSPIHRYIEQGSPAVDLKPGLLSGPKARQGEHGPYNIVAFRHGVPGTLQSNNPMPVNIYSLVQKNVRQATQARRQMSQQAAAKRSATGQQTVVGRSVTQGQRTKLVSQMLQGSKNYTWRAGPYANMQRITGAAKSSQYITFRTVSIRSDPSSWIVPPREGIPIRQAVVREVHEDAQEILREALTRDLS